MSSTNKTSHYELSQFIGTDKPAWLTDYNGDMLKIDTGLAAAAAEASGAQGTATSAASAAQAAQNTANQAVTSAQANAEDLTELKAALTNTVDTLTRLGNASTGSGIIAYSDYIQTFRFSIGWGSTLPNNTSVNGDKTVFPLYSVSGNIFKIPASTITDNNAKVSFGVATIRFKISSSASTLISTCAIRAYYDGSNTIIYGFIPTTAYSDYTLIDNIWGNFITLFSGNFVSLDE